ncbi:MAG: hypothetical protein AUK31_05205 [Fibrobacteres bacterium CG2_30_45_31]|nr:MAG: hypothetical protein AUK31_05205 [Fibrobacteres bacterium CG2_30_45_31]
MLGFIAFFKAHLFSRKFISANLVPRFARRSVSEVHFCETSFLVSRGEAFRKFISAKPRSSFCVGEAFLKFISAWVVDDECELES